MNKLSEIIQKYHALEEYALAEIKKIDNKISLAEHEAEKFAKKSEEMKELAKKLKDEERKIYHPYWKEDVVDKLAKVLAEKSGLRWTVYGPCGIACRCYILLYEDAEQRPRSQKHKELVVRPDFIDGNLYIVYETGEKTDIFEKGTLGYESGMNYKTALLPDDTDEILSLFTDQDPIR